MTHDSHLTEDERHGLADGSLASAQLAAADAHRRSCAECAEDVDRIRRLMKRIDDSRSQVAPLPEGVDELWPAIRARIEERKVVVLAGAASVAPTGAPAPRTWRWQWAVGGLVAASLLGVWLARDRVNPAELTTIPAVADSGIALVALVDSANAYENEAQALLQHLELRRATLRPEAARALESDLHTIDVAIAELQDAIKNDPANPALRRLLASSFRQKVDLLKRVGNAG